MFDLVTVIGVIGAAIILFGFFMNQTHRWRDTDRVYDVTNFIGGVLMTAYAFLIGSMPFAVLNVVWAFISLRDLLSKK